MSLLTTLTASKAPKAVVLIRLMVGAVFLSEGIQKSLFPAKVGAGRFEKIGLPNPGFLGPFVGGALVLIGLCMRLATLPLLTIMGVAIYSRKIPILLKSGFWKMAHDSRTDFSMTLGALFLPMVGAGALLLDAWVHERNERNVNDGGGKPNSPAAR
jgi:uncharacterized membrane protein YphA (DoxX/SURF4 family)